MKRIFIICLWLAVCGVVGAQTDGTSGATISTSTQANTAATRKTPTHLDGRFKQVRESSMLEEPQVLTGRFTFDAPDKVVWTYDSGVQANLPEPILRFIGGAVNGTYLDNNEDFAILRTGNQLVLTPKKKRMQKVFSKIEMTMNRQGIAEQVVMTEPTGDKTTILFDWK